MFGFNRPRKANALDALKERMTLPELRIAEERVIDFYQGRNPYEHLRGEWPGAYAQFMRGFAYAVDRCKKEGITDFDRCEIIASTCGVSLAKASVAEKRVSNGR